MSKLGIGPLKEEPSVRRLTRPEFCIFCLKNLISYPELRFRVVYRCWDCSHSIRSENLSRSWCPDFFNFFKTYFLDRFKNGFFFKSKILTKFLKENFHRKLFGRIFENSLKKSNFLKKTFLDRSKKYFYKKLRIFSNIKIETKFHSGSNGTTLSIWKAL